MILKLASALLALMLLATVPYPHHGHGNTIMNTDRILQEDNPNAEYEMLVKVFLTTDNFRRIIDSPFFRQALEMSLKDYVNECNDDSNNKDGVDVLSYTSFDIDFTSQPQGNVEGKNDLNNTACTLLGSNWGNLQDITCYVEVKTKCSGPREACKKKLNERFIDNNIVQKTNKTGPQKNFCDFDITNRLKEMVTSSSIFNYEATESFTEFFAPELEQFFPFDFQQQTSDSLTGIANAEAEENPKKVEVIKCPECVHLEILQEFYGNFDLELTYKNHECEQQGINCNNENIATQIWLNGRNITNAAIDGRIGNLRSLRGLFLGNNEVVGLIPNSLGKLKNLESLRLENNKLEGPIPSTLGDINTLREFIATNNTLSNRIPFGLLYHKQLTILDLGNNDMSGTVPHKDCITFPNPLSSFMSRMYRKKYSITSEGNLEILSLYNNSLTGQIPRSLFKQPKLRVLSLANNSLGGTLPTEIGLAKELKVLDIRDNQDWYGFFVWQGTGVRGEIPSEIGEASKLEIINLFDNRLSGTIPSEIMQLTELSELVLDKNDLTGPIPDFHPENKLKIVSLGGGWWDDVYSLSSTLPSSISNLRNTRVFNFQYNELSGSIPSEIGNMTSLEYLVLSFNNLNGTLPSEMGNLSKLKEIWLRFNDLSGKIPTELGLLTNLRGIYLRNNNLSGSIPSELGLLTNLEYVVLWVNNLSGSVPSELFALPNLWSGTESWEKGIYVSGNPNLWVPCDQYYDPLKIDIECDEDRVPSAVPSTTSSPSLTPSISLLPSTTTIPSQSPISSPSTRPSISSSPTSSSPPSLNPTLSLAPSTNPTISLIPSATLSSAPSMDPQIIKIPNTPFYIGITEKTWEDCKSAAENNGFTFASIRNQAENDAVYYSLWSNEIWDVWLGGYQTSYEDEPAGNWAWLDGTPWTDSTYTNWDPGEPNDWQNREHYLYLRTWDGTWRDVNIDNKYSCIFRDPTSSSMPTQSPTSSSAPSSAIQPLFTFFEEILWIIDFAQAMIAWFIFGTFFRNPTIDYIL